MEVQEIRYSASSALKEGSAFRCESKLLKNIVYFFYKDDRCLYVGESGRSLFDRCFIHTHKEKNSVWFKEGNRVVIIGLDNFGDDIENMKSRQALKAVFILTNKPKYNKKG